MNQKYVLTRKRSDIIRSISDDSDYFQAQVASENQFTPTEASNALDELKRQGIVTIVTVDGYKSPKIKLTETGGKIRQGLQGNFAGSKSIPSVLILDDNYVTEAKAAGQREQIDTELDRVIKNLGQL